MAFKFNPTTGEFDLVGTSTVVEGTYVHLAGDKITGDLTFPVNGYIMIDSNSASWRVTVDTSGHLVTTKIVSGIGSPIGLLMSITYSS